MQYEEMDKTTNGSDESVSGGTSAVSQTEKKTKAGTAKKTVKKAGNKDSANGKKTGKGTKGAAAGRPTRSAGRNAAKTTTVAPAVSNDLQDLGMSDAPAEVNPVVAPTQKKRGRKSKAELAATATVVEAVSARRRGRPAGSKNQAKPVPAKRGRKSKAELAAMAAEAAKEVAKLSDTLTYKVNNAWEDKNLKRKSVLDFAEGYKAFLNKAKTERECIREAVIHAERKGFRNLDAIAPDMRLVPGDRVFRVVKNKLILLAVVGSDAVEDGVRILGAHVDSPRIDIKQNPLYEANEMAFLKTHYYGGIKKYQWTAIPLALHGVFVKTDGTTVDVVIGEDDKDPIFTITDLLPHLAKDQYEKKLSDAFVAESMNLLVGSEPMLGEDAKEKVKLNILRMLSEAYSIKEEDFLSAELEIVPAFKARDIGIDRSMVGAYGHDDRVCAYPALMAVLESEDPKMTSLCVLTDKEEIGSVGNTGAESRALENFLADLCAMSSVTPYTDRALRRCLDRSKMLSADVTAAVDPNYEGTHDKLNASYLGKGMAIMKYSGSRGKSGASDAHAEYVAEVRKILNDAGVVWQTTELGAVDKGGGGTIAMMIANLGVDVIDCGVPVLSMHAPFEIVSKVDLYNTYKAYGAFLK